MGNFNFHEYLTYTLCNDFFNYHPINEEKVSFNTQYQSDLNKRLQLMMNGSNETQRIFAYLFYLNQPQELHAFSQGIQQECADLITRVGLHFAEIPFDYLKPNIAEFQSLYEVKDDIDGYFQKLPANTIIAIISNALGIKINTIDKAKKYVEYAFYNIEQTYNKALSRAIEKYAIISEWIDYAPKDFNSMEKQIKKINEIYREYGYPSHLNHGINKIK